MCIRDRDVGDEQCEDQLQGHGDKGVLEGDDPVSYTHLSADHLGDDIAVSVEHGLQDVDGTAKVVQSAAVAIQSGVLDPQADACLLYTSVCPPARWNSTLTCTCCPVP